MAILQNTTVSGSLVVTGDLTARQFILSSSVTFFTESFASGSTRFGDSMDDTMVVTGSLRLTGSMLIGSTTDSGATFQVTGTSNLTGALTGTSATFSDVITGQKNGNTFGTASTTGRGIIVQAGSTNQAIMLKNAAGGDGTIFATGTSTSLNYAFNTYSVGDAFVILNNGNVGISVTPTAKLQVLTNSGISHIFETQAGLLPLYQYRRSGAALANIANTDAVASMEFIARANSSWLTIAKIYAEYSGNGTTQSGNLQFYTSNAGSEVERMRITSAGNVLIGTTTDNGQKLQVAGALNCRGASSGMFTENRISSNLFGFYGNLDFILYNSDIGTIGTFSYNTGVYTPSSDINRKKDFELSTIGLNEVLKLKPTLFRMKDENDNIPKTLGFIAQEVKEVIPQAYVEQDKFIGLSDRPIISALVKAIQEQQAQIEELKALIAAK